MIRFVFSATALQSLEIACDSILSGKAKVMIAGGFDDISEEGSYEFANMKATSNAETEFAMGREPTEMSRPATTSRAGVSLSYSPPCPSTQPSCPLVHGVTGTLHQSHR
jgi:3-oxoacyl-(acyl-carrier-protein) synthase